MKYILYVAILVASHVTQADGEFAESGAPLPVQTLGDNAAILEGVSIQNIRIQDLDAFTAFKDLLSFINKNTRIPFRIAFDLRVLSDPAFKTVRLTLSLVDISPIEALRYFTLASSTHFCILGDTIVIIPKAAEQGAAANP